MNTLKELYIAGFKEYIRDSTALFWALAFPILFIVIFGIIFSGNDDVSFSIGIVNEDGEASADLVEAFQQVSAFDLSEGNREDELAALKDGDRRAVIIIPTGTDAALDANLNQAGNSVPLEVYYDPSNQNTAQIILSVIDKVVNGIGQGMTGVAPVFAVQQETITSEELRSIDYLLPGILSMSIMQIGLFATAGPLVSLRVKKVLRRIGATPVKRWKVMAAQIAMRLTVAMMQTLVIITVGVLLFKVHIEVQNMPGIIGMVLLGALMFTTFGYFLSTLANTEEAVMGIVQLPNMLFMFLSGIFFPLDFMPNWIRPLVNIIPLTYLGDALRQLMVGAGGFHDMTTNILVLSVWLVVCAGLSVRFFRWE